MLNWLKPWCKGGFMNDSDGAGEEISAKREELDETIVCNRWKVIYEFLKLEARSATISRKTNETDIYINLNLDGKKQNRNWNCL
jgi:imidazoleglycerol-phosphate dehydratase/histidinol-phosphatase